MSALRISSGTIRNLTKEEIESNPEFEKWGYCWVVESEYKYEGDIICITVPKGFLTDGSSGGPDYGCSWLFHDWLYATHQFDGNVKCTRDEADEVMESVLKSERLGGYCKIFELISDIDIFGLFSSAWESSGHRGPQFLDQLCKGHKDQLSDQNE